jgi:hypothetical protein
MNDLPEDKREVEMYARWDGAGRWIRGEVAMEADSSFSHSQFRRVRVGRRACEGDGRIGRVYEQK